MAKVIDQDVSSARDGLLDVRCHRAERDRAIFAEYLFGLIDATRAFAALAFEIN